MLNHYSTDHYSTDRPTTDEGKVSKQKTFELSSIVTRDINNEQNFPQDSANLSLPISVGGLGANLSLFNLALFSVQVNVSQGGDSQSISVNGGTQTQSH